LCKVFLNYIDDFSRFTWVYILKKKDIVFEKFKEFRALAKKKCGEPVKCLKFDNGGEHVNRAFEGFLSRMLSHGNNQCLILLNVMVSLRGRTRL
jgi:hypothetical protein